MEFPSISMKQLEEENPGEEMKRLAQACHEWGCFQLVDHGIPKETINAFTNSLKTYFQLPQEVKEKKILEERPEKEIYDKNGEPYYITKTETFYQKDAVPLFRVENQFDDTPATMKPETWIEQLVIRCRPSVEEMIENGLEKPVGLAEKVHKYAKEIERVGEKVLRCLSVNIGLNPDVFSDVYGGKESGKVMVLNSIPPVPTGAAALTAPTHKDNSGLTLLLVVDGRQGLQVVKDGEWKSVPWTDPYSIVVSCGDLMEVISNGRYKSLVHRGLNLDETVRYSVAFGYNPNPLVKIGPVADLIDEEHPRLYGEGRHADFFEAAMDKPMTCLEYFTSLK